MYPITSRYYAIQIVTRETPDGRPVAHLRRRFVPAPERFEQIAEHVVTEGERLDNIADPEQFWRLCDANGALRPAELTETVGRRLRITLPEGIPATPHA
jgi:hypothetical protein